MDSTRDSRPENQIRPKGRAIFGKPLLVMFGLFVLCLIIAGMLGATRGQFASVFLDAGVVSVGGALLSLVADNYRRAHEERHFRETFLKEILKRVTAAYNTSKGARRLVRAELVPDTKRPTHVQAEAYRKFIAELNDAQLEFEAVKLDLETSCHEGFPSDELGRGLVEDMERHLGAIVGQYEKFRSTPDNPTDLPLREVDKFAAFVNPNDNSDFKKEYASLHSAMRRTINKELLLLASGMKPKVASEKRKRAVEAGADRKDEDELD